MILHRPAPAKLNLGLHILRRRPDGYHDLATVFLRIGWADHLTAAPAETLTLTCTDASLPTDERNLCLRAAHRLAEVYGVGPEHDGRGAALHLEKHVPYGAGLGGGSSDAAATLLLLNDLWDLDASQNDLHALAADLGSDVPFFLGPPAAYGTGRGEMLTPLNGYACPFWLVVVAPGVHVATAEAYRLVTPSDADRPGLPRLVQSNDLARWRTDLVNDFEAPILAQYPALRAVKRTLLDAGAGYAALTGSGSALFGVFEEERLARAAAEAARQAGHRVWWGRTDAARVG